MRRRKEFILGFILAVFLVPMTAFAGASSEGDMAQEEVVTEESYMDCSGIAITNEDIDETNEQGNAKLQGTTGSSVTSTSYSYTITPLLSPFNQYFFVKTDNPDPRSFRFADTNSVYGSDATISLNWDDWDEVPVLYADVQYENAETGRVNGGYIFRSYDTDGGEVILQETENPKVSSPVWNNTNTKKTLPALVDVADYLISTYADKTSFFENMTAVQRGFSNICLYSGSFVRGTLLKPNDYWFVAVAGHIDQSYYIYSPYLREDSRSLFATAVYPFRYDSLGFPNMMGKVAQRLDSSATFVWNSKYHYLIDVTYGGETKSYGGQGEGEGQGITEDKILQYFTFGNGAAEITLSGARSLLESYAALEIEDDIPRDDALTWQQFYDAAGPGTWARISGSNARSGNKWDLDSSVYTFIYQKSDDTNFNTSEWGVGYSSYFGGGLGYARDAWADGRYVSEMRKYIPGETFEDHPTSNIILCDVAIPQINYSQSYNSSLGELEYEITDITEETKTVLFKYNDGKWTVATEAFNSGCASYEKIALFAEKGLVDEQYLDMVTITQDEIEALGVDRNTNIIPDKGCVFDGIEPPGTPFDHDQGHCWNLGVITTKPGCLTTGEKQFTCLVCGETRNETVPAAGHNNPLRHVEAVEATCTEIGNIEYWYCSKCRKYFSDKDAKNEIDRDSCYLWWADHQWDEGRVTQKATCMEYGEITYTCKVCQETYSEWIDPTDHEWKHVINKAGLLKNGSEYDQCIYCKEKKNSKKLTGYATYYVKGFKVAAAKASFTAKWTKQSKAKQKKFSGYQIRYSTKSNMKGAKYKTASKKSASKKITKLKKKTKYYIQVRTYTISKNVKYYSKWSKKLTVKTK